MDEITQFKERARATWAAGDYGNMAERISEVGENLVRRMQVKEGEQVLDVACGTDNVAIPAAKAGGRVTGLDLTPELLEKGRAKAAKTGVEIEWKEGDAEALPFPDKSYDLVLSTFGCMFAPRHEVTAREMARVLRPDGRIGICSWTPEGSIGDFFKMMSGYLPPPPPFASPPLLWGTEPHLKKIFEGSGIDFEFERQTVVIRFDSVEDALETYTTKFGPTIKAREILEPQGRWPALLKELGALYERVNTATDGSLALPSEYLRAVGRKR
jgi:SAM-dependent methyltransferase